MINILKRGDFSTLGSILDWGQREVAQRRIRDVWSVEVQTTFFRTPFAHIRTKNSLAGATCNTRISRVRDLEIFSIHL